MTRFLKNRLAVLLLVVAAVAMFAFSCGQKSVDPTEMTDSVPVIINNSGDTTTTGTNVTAKVVTYGPLSGPAWEANLLSEAKYALSQSRSGYSNLIYRPSQYISYYMSDWAYPTQGDCCDALGTVTKLMYGSTTSPSRGALGKWLGLYQQGGECKFFVNLVLYRSSYGFPGGHLKLPGGGVYTYKNPQNWRNAQPGYILQSASMPHTAIVVANYGSGLTVIDANWVGGRGSYAIARHNLSAADLDANGYSSYRPTDACNIEAL